MLFRTAERYSKFSPFREGLGSPGDRERRGTGKACQPVSLHQVSILGPEPRSNSMRIWPRRSATNQPRISKGRRSLAMGKDSASGRARLHRQKISRSC